MKTTRRNGLIIYESDDFMPQQYWQNNFRESRFKTSYWDVKEQERVQKLRESDQQKCLTQYYDPNIINDIRSDKFEIPDFVSEKSVQSVFLKGGELFMEQNPNLEDTEVVQRPENRTCKGEVTEVRVGKVEEMWDMESIDDLGGIDPEDKRIQIDITVEFDGNTFKHTADYPFHESPSSNTNLGQYINRWGTPETGQEVSVDFDNDGNGQVVGVGE